MLLFALNFLANLLADCGPGSDCVHGVCGTTDGSFVCLCKRGWTGTACDVVAPNFKLISSGSDPKIEKAVNFACLVNGTECDTKRTETCLYHNGAYSCQNKCPDGFVIYDGECISKRCYSSSSVSSDTPQSNPPCNGKGKCVLKDLAKLDRADEADYVCSCFPIYRGDLCDTCNLENSVESEADKGKCNPRSCQDSDGLVCSGKGKCELDFGYNLTHYSYQCICDAGYTRVGHSCIPSACVVYLSGTPVTCGGFGECKENPEGSNSFSCACYEGTVKVGNGCTYRTCTESESASKICGGIGVCVRDDTEYKCDCKGFATGSLCDSCVSENATSVGNQCIPNECLDEAGTTVCKGNGKCIRASGRYYCQCPNMTTFFNKQCISVNCIDQELNLICSGHGTCDTTSPKDMKCTCESGYEYIAPGRCISSTLLGTDKRVCNGNGYVAISSTNTIGSAPNLVCICSPIYTGENCSTCNTTGENAPAEQVDSNCVPKSVIVKSTQLHAKEVTTKVCDEQTEYVIYGDTTRPYMTCRVKNTDEKKVIAYNATLLVEPDCMHVSQVDRTRRFYCGFAEGLTDGITTNGPSCNTNTNIIPSTSTCVCPTNFKLVEFIYGKNKGKHTCIHDDCHDGNQTYNQNNYCGGVGDCIKKPGASKYACDCGQGARWDETIRECVAETCKIDKLIYGPSEREYCTEINIAASIDNVCLPDDSGRWGCHCTGRYMTYGSTCTSYAAYATEKDDRARGPCGGPGAGYINDRNKCVCYPGFVSIDGKCYSKQCLAMGVIGSYNISHVCSGLGVCAYNPVTGFYGCECPKDTESYGAYCTHTGCVGQVFSEGELRYVQCGVHTRSIQCKQNSKDNTYSCICYTPYKKIGNLCVHQRCINGDIYCSGDLLANCELLESIYQCQCSEGYVKGRSPHECIPKKCTYRRYESDLVTECGGLGRCEGDKLITKKCKCNDGAELVSMIDISGEMHETCVSKSCISKQDDTTIVCGGYGRCDGNACICDGNLVPVGNVCVSSKCVVQLASGSTSVCGGSTVGTCTKGQGEDHYSCKCATPGKTGFKEVDGYCLPNKCVFNVKQNGKDVDTMCGGASLGSCIIDPTGDTSYCSCLRWYNITTLSSGQCISTRCVNSVTSDKKECGGNGRCAYTDGTGYECQCNSGYKTVTVGRNIYPCISENCLAGESMCSGHGECVNNGCSCNKGYTGSKCESCATGYRETNSVCYLDECPQSGCGLAEAGTCAFTGLQYQCSCNTGFVLDTETKACRRPLCTYIDPFDGQAKICYNMGTCAQSGSTGKCVCNQGTVALNDNICVFENCITNKDSSEICEGKGVCERSPESNTGICVCNTSLYRTDKKSGRCFPVGCFSSQETGLTNVCNGGGTCSVTGVVGICNCDSDWVTIEGMCYPVSCVFGGAVCSGFGKCIFSSSGEHRCLCDQGYEPGEDLGTCITRSTKAKQGAAEISIIVVVVVALVILAVAIFLIWKFVIKPRSKSRKRSNNDLNQRLITVDGEDAPVLSPRARGQTLM
ncbi:High cysteine membrane protein EGF-like [Giardia duodenalis]|uniref:High cysteine membrane protein EGF-like n=1 Tax=Giardia intestinalis (strain ATCC 50803 / WB clone C6) TaxID=184922 RepID=A8B2J5_GIAIC|nr:High cysteine membrane protein EGF-like [Giardia intestinalis]KAE8302989.1 High cysteine membrane protein EGF-like [Giardia intestinalis]|eukprot:XP_001709985.1 High cysteine membrane protein EGF-like [Giardia lamblia ATCC 50803]